MADADRYVDGKLRKSRQGAPMYPNTKDINKGIKQREIAVRKRPNREEEAAGRAARDAEMQARRDEIIGEDIVSAAKKKWAKQNLADNEAKRLLAVRKHNEEARKHNRDNERAKHAPVGSSSAVGWEPEANKPGEAEKKDKKVREDKEDKEWFEAYKLRLKATRAADKAKQAADKAKPKQKAFDRLMDPGAAPKKPAPKKAAPKPKGKWEKAIRKVNGQLVEEEFWVPAKPKQPKQPKPFTKYQTASAPHGPSRSKNS